MSFECLEGCGGCCGIIPLPADLAAKTELFQTEPTDAHILSDSGDVLFATKDGKCVFLDRESARCGCYDERPAVCRVFGTSQDERLQCPYLRPNGNPRSDAERKRIERLQKRQLRRIGGDV